MTFISIVGHFLSSLLATGSVLSTSTSMVLSHRGTSLSLLFVIVVVKAAEEASPALYPFPAVLGSLT